MDAIPVAHPYNFFNHEGAPFGFSIGSALQKHDISLDVRTGASAYTLDRFGLGNMVPGTIILDENGYAIARIMGGARENDIRSAVDWLLDQRKGPAPAPMLRRY